MKCVKLRLENSDASLHRAFECLNKRSFWLWFCQITFYLPICLPFNTTQKKKNSNISQSMLAQTLGILICLWCLGLTICFFSFWNCFRLKKKWDEKNGLLVFFSSSIHSRNRLPLSDHWEFTFAIYLLVWQFSLSRLFERHSHSSKSKGQWKKI